jgi:hypothetical protein
MTSTTRGLDDSCSERQGRDAERQGRRRWLVAGGLLALAQVGHIVNSAAIGSPESPAPGISQPGHVAVLTVTLVALAGVAMRQRWARLLLAACAGGVVVAALAYHALPGLDRLTNSYWDGGDLLDWGTVVAAVATGLWCLHVTRPLQSSAAATA